MQFHSFLNTGELPYQHLSIRAGVFICRSVVTSQDFLASEVASVNYPDSFSVPIASLACLAIGLSWSGRIRGLSFAYP